MKEEFGRRTSEAEALKLNLKKAEDQLEAAERLLGKLGGEKDRWSDQVISIDVALKALPLNSLLAAGFIAYLPAAPEDRRLETTSRWTEYLGVERFDLRRFMSSESEMLTVESEGPARRRALDGERGGHPCSRRRAPLIIDPVLRKPRSGSRRTSRRTTRRRSRR
jgi:dynein heavy chain 2